MSSEAKWLAVRKARLAAAKSQVSSVSKHVQELEEIIAEQEEIIAKIRKNAHIFSMSSVFNCNLKILISLTAHKKLEPFHNTCFA